MAKLPQQLSWDMASNRWSAMIEPIINNPRNSSTTIKNIVLATGLNIIDHRLGRPLQGWSPSRIRGVQVMLYDNQDANQTPQLTLALVSSADVSIDLEVW